MDTLTADLGATPGHDRVSNHGRRRPRPRWRRVVAGALVAIVVVLGGLAVAPAADATVTTHIPGVTATNCATATCAIIAADHVVRTALGSEAPDGVYTLRIAGCSRVGNLCTMRGWYVTLTYADGELVGSRAFIQAEWVEDCRDLSAGD